VVRKNESCSVKFYIQMHLQTYRDRSVEKSVASVARDQSTTPTTRNRWKINKRLRKKSVKKRESHTGSIGVVTLLLVEIQTWRSANTSLAEGAKSNTSKGAESLRSEARSS
jgi:hypothetical protein